MGRVVKDNNQPPLRKMALIKTIKISTYKPSSEHIRTALGLDNSLQGFDQRHSGRTVRGS